MKQKYQHPQTISIPVCVSEILAGSRLDGTDISGGNGDVGTLPGLDVDGDNESGEGMGD